ncbi:nucleoside:proton symporter [Altererythrobacter sp. B11]|nr:nucleoside:proton symporter [Altererythrobacter sp. B11]
MAGPATPPASEANLEVIPLSGGDRTLAMRLSAMMLLEFFVFGAWFATLGLVLATNGAADIIGQAYLLSAVAAIISPLFMGAIGDRYLPPRVLLSLLHVAGAIVLFAIPNLIASGATGTTLAMIFVHMLFFQPTLGLVNSLALAELGVQQRIFPYVRVFGPLGWVVAGLTVGALGFSASTNVFYVAAAGAVALAIYALTLPASPPPAKGARFSLGDVIGIDALSLFRDRKFAVLMGCTLFTSISLAFYNAFASPYLGALGFENVAGVLALGQLSEVLFIVTIPFVLARISMKAAMLFGMAMWGVRFLLFILAADGSNTFAVVGVALHGICNDYFIVIAAMFIAKIAPARLAAQAQSWLILMISGFGAAIGSALSGQLFAAFVTRNVAEGASAWVPMWWVPVGLAVATTVIWIALFPSKPAGEKPKEDYNV